MNLFFSLFSIYICVCVCVLNCNSSLGFRVLRGVGGKKEEREEKRTRNEKRRVKERRRGHTDGFLSLGLRS